MMTAYQVTRTMRKIGYTINFNDMFLDTQHTTKQMEKVIAIRETKHFDEIFWKVLQPGFWAKCWLKWEKVLA